VDREIWQAASLDAAAPSRWRGIALPLMRGSLILAWCICFVLALAETTTFDLAGTRTIGTELERLYLETASTQAVAFAAWPAVVASLLVAALLWRRMWQWSLEPPLATLSPSRGAWVVTMLLLALSIGVPVALLAAGVRSLAPLGRFWALHRQELTGSLTVSAVAAVAAVVLAGGALAMQARGRWVRALAGLEQITILLALLIPGSILAAALVELSAGLSLSAAVRQSWLNVSAGQAARLAGVALLVLHLGRDTQDRHLSEMAAVDGASPWQAQWHVHWPRLWPWILAAGVVVGLLGLTELSASLVLLPAGAPSFARWLLNQMHYAWEQDVIIGCLVLVATYVLVALAVLALVHLGRRRWAAMPAIMLALCLAALALPGCAGGNGGASGKSAGARQPRDVHVLGRTGRGNGEFVYPRGVCLGENGTVWVLDRTGRIQHFDAGGEFLGQILMPETEAGFPVGAKVGPDGLLYVADTHYHRVCIYRGDGTLVRQFGSHGQGPGQFIFPTDVAIADDGRVFVSEYGGNDRVSVFSPQGEFLFSFGSLGEGPEQFSRPEALCLDRRHGLLYVADACNHRIVIYDLSGKRRGQLGQLGSGPGQLRYPYGLALTPEGHLVVSEFGNNRIQVLDAQGRCLAVVGEAGRQPGQLACPWGVAVDGRGRAYIAEAGNNRVQIWSY
jgi:ABC-type spermidine/putrescine transport system permease subunit II/DNA-binding beta-propeller fold protein YncE